MRYRSREEVEAVQWTGRNATALATFVREFALVGPHMLDEKPPLLWVDDHWVELAPTDVVVSNGAGLEVVTGECFADSYEPVV